MFQESKSLEIRKKKTRIRNFSKHMNANLQKTKYQVEEQTVNSDFFYWLKFFVESYELIINSMHKNMFSPVVSSRGDGRDGVMVIFFLIKCN